MDVFLQSYLFYSAKLSVVYLCYLAASILLLQNTMGKTHYRILIVILLGFLIPFRPMIGGISLTQNMVEWVQQVPVNTPIQQNEWMPTLPNIPTQPMLENRNIPFNFQQLWFAMFGIWIFGISVVILYTMIKYRAFLKMVKRWRCLEESLEQQLAEIKEEWHIHGKIQIYACEFIETPMLYGFFLPTILIPTSLKKEDRIDLYIKHELIHYKRKDIGLKLLALLVAALHWFNPLVKHMLKRLELIGEITCDEEVNEKNSPEDRAVYATLVLSLAQQKNRSVALFSTQFNGGKNDMEKRIFSIMQPRKKRGLFAMVSTMCFVLLTTNTFGATNNGKPEVYKDVQQGIEISVVDGYIQPGGSSPMAPEEDVITDVSVMLAVRDLTGNRIEKAIEKNMADGNGLLEITFQDFEMVVPGEESFQPDFSKPMNYDHMKSGAFYNPETKTLYITVSQSHLKTDKDNLQLRVTNLLENPQFTMEVDGILVSKGRQLTEEDYGTKIEAQWVLDFPMPKTELSRLRTDHKETPWTTNMFGVNVFVYDVYLTENVVSIFCPVKKGETVEQTGNADVTVNYKNGKKVKLKSLYLEYTEYNNQIGSGMLDRYMGHFSGNFQAQDEKIDLSQVKSVTINGVEIPKG